MEYKIPKFRKKNSWELNKKLQKIDKDLVKSESGRLWHILNYGITLVVLIKGVLTWQEN